MRGSTVFRAPILGAALSAALLLTVPPATGAQEPLRPEAPPAPPAGPRGIWLGVLLRDAPDGGVEVVEVVPGSPAARSGMRAGDLVLEADSRPTPDRRSLHRSLASARPGMPLRFTILRDGKTEDVTILAGPKPEVPLLSILGEGGVEAPEHPTAVELLAGLDLEGIPPELRLHLGSRPDLGVLVASVKAASPAQEAGLRAGDLLLRAGGAPLREPTDLGLVLGSGPAHSLTLEVLRRGASRPLRVSLPVQSVQAVPRAGGARGLAGARVRELEGAISRLKARLAALEAELERLKRER